MKYWNEKYYIKYLKRVDFVIEDEKMIAYLVFAKFV